MPSSSLARATVPRMAQARAPLAVAEGGARARMLVLVRRPVRPEAGQAPPRAAAGPGRERCGPGGPFRASAGLLPGGTEALPEDLRGLVHLRLGDDERGHEAHNLGARGHEEEPARGRGGAHLRRGGLHRVAEFEAAEEAPAADLLDRAVPGLGGHLAQARGQLRAPHLRAGHEARAVELVQNGDSRRAREEVPAKSGGVVPGLEDGGGVRAGHRADGHAPAQGLGGADHVGRDAQVLVAPEAARAAHPGLHLIDHQQRAALVADAAGLCEEGAVPGGDAALPLERLEQDGGEAVLLAQPQGPAPLRPGDGLPEGGHVVVGCVHKALGHGAEGVLVLGLPGGCDGGQRAPVEAVPRGHHEGPLHPARGARVLAGQLDGRLVGLRPGVAEEHLVSGRPIKDFAGQLALLRDVVEVGDVRHAGNLAGDCVHEGRVRVPEHRGGDARGKVEVARPVDAPERAALTAVDGNALPGVGAHHGAVEGRLVEGGRL
mmetsp:Transcript_2953/g.9707  ORF Transcript_2953/g.9707 Transcript_2953/m.9707 type:complete len:489 (-) Transcript_2953:104-1570(-)